MHPPQYEDFTTAYQSILNQVHHHPQHTTNARGKNSRERLNMAFTLIDPRRRTPQIAERRSNIVFNVAEALWYLWGRDDLEMIGYYAPRLTELSEDGNRLTGTAYGPRIFGPTLATSQWQHAVDLLRADPDTKRAAIMIMRPGEFADPGNPDVACTTSLQFLNRRNSLHTVVTMRANDGYIGLLGDVFAFTFIAEFTALQLGLNLGPYTHVVTSIHVNEADRIQVEKTIGGQGADFPALKMPKTTTWEVLAEVREWERRLRLNETAVDDLAAVPVPPYWRQVIGLFEIYRKIVHQPGEWVTGPDLNPLNRWLVRHRWPERFREVDS